jgi:hypothetical protein
VQTMKYLSAFGGAAAAATLAAAGHTSSGHVSGQAIHPAHQIRRHGESRERRFITGPRAYSGKRQSEHSAHLQHEL